MVVCVQAPALFLLFGWPIFSLIQCSSSPIRFKLRSTDQLITNRAVFVSCLVGFFCCGFCVFGVFVCFLFGFLVLLVCFLFCTVTAQ